MLQTSNRSNSYLLSQPLIVSLRLIACWPADLDRPSFCQPKRNTQLKSNP